jgi:hypothetical protein
MIHAEVILHQAVCVSHAEEWSIMIQQSTVHIETRNPSFILKHFCWKWALCVVVSIRFPKTTGIHRLQIPSFGNYYQTSQVSCWNFCIVIGKCRVRIRKQRLYILTEAFRDFPQSPYSFWSSAVNCETTIASFQRPSNSLVTVFLPFDAT